MDLTLQTRDAAVDAVVVEVSGEVDVFTAPQLRDALSAQIEAGVRRIVVDLTKVEFLDSTGLGVLVGGMKRAREVNGSLEMVCNQQRLLKIFSITGLDKVFTIHDEVPELDA